jgi:ATP-dependent Zn protease
MHQSLSDIFINWFPMLLLIGVWIFFIMRLRRNGGITTQYQRDCMDLTRRQVDALERIVKLLEEKKF